MTFISILAPKAISFSHITDSSIIVTVVSQDKIPPVQRYEVTARAGESSQACDINAGSDNSNCSLSALLPGTEYQISVVVCISGPGNCGAPAAKNVTTLPTRKHLLSFFIALQTHWLTDIEMGIFRFKP